MQRWFWRASKWSFLLLIGLAFVGMGTLVFIPQFEGAAGGCFWMVGILPTVECRDVPFAGLLSFAMNLPLTVLLSPIAFVGLLIANGGLWQQPAVLLLGLPAYVLVLGSVYPARWLWLKLCSH